MDQDAPRTLEQNAKFHAMCRDLARQLKWAEMRLEEEDWKRLLLAAKYEQKVVPNPFKYGFVVVNSKRSRDLNMEQFSEFLMEIQAMGDEHGIEWTDED